MVRSSFHLNVEVWVQVLRASGSAGQTAADLEVVLWVGEWPPKLSLTILKIFRNLVNFKLSHYSRIFLNSRRHNFRTFTGLSPYPRISTGRTIWSSVYQKTLPCFCHMCCIFWSAFGCCTLQMLVSICFLKVFEAKKLKKEKKHKNWPKIWQKIGY